MLRERLRAWLLVGVFGLIAADGARAVPETELLERYNEIVEKFWQSGETATFAGVGGIELSYWSIPPVAENGPKLLVVPGYGEPYLRYAELLYDLRAHGFGFYIYDHRGMGLSGDLAPNPQTIHVEEFAHYVTDLDTFYKTAVLPRHGQGPVYLLAHSMGGLAALHWLAQHQPPIEKVVLSAPLLGLETGGVPLWAAKLTANTMVWLGFGQDYVFGRSDRQLSDLDPHQARATSSVARQMILHKVFADYPTTLNGGPSHRWLQEALAAIDAIHGQPHAIAAPILMLQAEIENFALTPPQTEFCAALPHCQRRPMPGAMHELLHERDELRNQALAALREYLGVTVEQAIIKP